MCQKHKTSINQKLVTETVIIEHVFSLRCLVNSFTDVSFLMVTNGEKDFWATGIFFLEQHHK